MKTSALVVTLLIELFVVSCKTRNDTSVKDIGVVNTQDATTKVLYSDQNKVYLKVCKPPLAPPLTRDCSSDEVPKYLELDYYIFKLPYDVGPYQRNKEGLGLVTKALQDAQNAVAGGNQNAVPSVNRLTPFRLNLEKMMKLRDDLAVQKQDLTFYEYQDEFGKLLAPFGEAAPAIPLPPPPPNNPLPPPNNPPPPPNNQAALTCADYYASPKSLGFPTRIAGQAPATELWLELTLPVDALVLNRRGDQLNAASGDGTNTRVYTLYKTLRDGRAVTPGERVTSYIKVVCSVNGRQFETTKILEVNAGMRIEIGIDPIHP